MRAFERVSHRVRQDGQRAFGEPCVPLPGFELVRHQLVTKLAVHVSVPQRRPFAPTPFMTPVAPTPRRFRRVRHRVTFTIPLVRPVRRGNRTALVLAVMTECVGRSRAFAGLLFPRLPFFRRRERRVDDFVVVFFFDEFEDIDNFDELVKATPGRVLRRPVRRVEVGFTH